MSFEYAVYFTERGRNRVVRWEPDSGSTEVVAGEPPDGDPTQKLRDPYGLAFDDQGDLLIADKLHNRICRLRQGRLEAIPLLDVDGHRARKPDTRRSYNPTLLSPTGLHVEATGTLLCSFADDYTIYRIHGHGRLELVLGMVRNRNYHFGPTREYVPLSEVQNTPVNVPVGLVERSDGTLFFIERRPQILREYHPSRGLRSVFPRSMAGRFRTRREAPERAPLAEYHPAYPGSLALDANENLYMSDLQHAGVLRVDLSSGEVRRIINLPRTDPRQEGGCVGSRIRT